MCSFFIALLFTFFTKYFLQGLAVAVTSYVILSGGSSFDYKTILMMAGAAGLGSFVLDIFSPGVSASLAVGQGFGLGNRLVGFPVQVDQSLNIEPFLGGGLSCGDVPAIRVPNDPATPFDGDYDWAPAEIIIADDSPISSSGCPCN